jgi:ATP-dependent DNA helicase RecG
VTASELFAELNALDEHPRMEAKQARTFSLQLLETVCAFANEPGLGGGHLLLGVRRREGGEPRYEVVGVPDPDKLQADLASQCGSVFNRAVRCQMQTELLDGRPVVSVFVPEQAAGEKPIFFKSQGLPRGAFRRIGSTDQRCTEDDLLILYHGRAPHAYDETPLPETDVTADIDPAAIAEYRRARREANPDAEELRWSDLELLRALHCTVRHDGGQVLTIAGLVLFGTTQALRRLLPMARLDYIRVPGREWMAGTEPLQTVELRGPLLLLLPRALTTVLEELPKALSLPPGEFQRRDEPIIPVRVIREALVNAVMHRSYRIHGPIQVIRYQNRLEVRNPGHSLVALDRLGEPGSRTRNPSVAAVLHETRYAETKGSGVRVMRQMMRDANLSPPSFESDREADTFVATLLFHHFLGEQDLQWLSRFQEAGLQDDEARILIFVREKGSISNAECRSLTGLDTLTASGRLRRLRDLGLLQQRERGPATYYVGTPRLLGQERSPPALQAPLPPTQAALLPNLTTLPPKLQALLPEFPEVPAELWEAVARLGRRSSPAEVQAVISRLCGVRPFGAAELSRILGRAQDWIRKSYLYPMLRDGVLERTLPDPNDPRQTYRATVKRNA